MAKQDRRKDIDALFRDGRAIDAALKKAVRDAIVAHARAGVPIVVERKGRIVSISARRLMKRPTRATSSRAKSRKG